MNGIAANGIAANGIAARFALFVSSALVLAATGVAAEPKYDSGADDTTIKVGHINPYSGPFVGLSAR